MSHVKILDAVPGTGKSSWAFKHLNSAKETNWIYVSPYLDEVGDGRQKGRIHTECPELDFKSPQQTSRQNKSENLEELLENSKNIACTHALFNRMTSEHCKWIKHHNYAIIIDEVLEGISLLSASADLRQDIIALLSEEFLLQHDDGRLEWNPSKPILRSYSEIVEYCERGELYLYLDDVLIRRGNIKAISSAKECWVMTYLFESSVMSKWLRMHGVPYEYAKVDLHRSPEKAKEDMCKLIKVVDVPRNIQKIEKAQRNPDYCFSATSYAKRLRASDMATMKRAMESAVRRYRDDPHLHSKGNVIWTTFKDYEERLVGRGYTQSSDAYVEDATSPFASKNMRASNQYSNKNIVFYTVNVFAHPTITSYIEHIGQEIDEDAYALSECIQFVYRSAIRKSEPIILMFFSTRMKTLFEQWLHDKSQ